MANDLRNRFDDKLILLLIVFMDYILEELNDGDLLGDINFSKF